MLEKIGRYEIRSELGRGGMATVYLGYDPRSEREVAIKVLPHEMLHDAQFRTRFEREAKTIALLEHPAIVPVYDFGEEDGQPYFVMRYMTGGSLADRIKKGPIPLQESARIFSKIAPALDEAHAKGIVHRDIKPGNILFDQYNEPYIADFGIAKLSQSSVSVTGSAIIGTPAYMSPEQAQGGEVDGRADIYALGTILFEMLTGQQPFEGESPMSVVVKHITEPTPHILDVKPDLPSNVEPIIEKAMAKNRDDRYASVTDTSNALSAVARGELPQIGKTVAAAPPKTVMAKKKTGGAQPGGAEAKPKTAPKKLWIGIGAGSLVLCAAVVGSLFLFKVIPLGTSPTTAPKTTDIVLPVGGDASPTNTPDQVLPTDTAAPPTDTPAPSETPTPAPLNIGGADMIGFLGSNNVWIMNVDGTGLTQLTTDGAVKKSLQWSPDGQGLIYISGKCVMEVNIVNKDIATVACFPGAEFFDDFQISPDGTQVGISLNYELIVVPFDREKLATAKTRSNLEAMNPCYTYRRAKTTGVHWSNDNKYIAMKILGVLDQAGTIQAEYIQVMNISKCDPTWTFDEETFPSNRIDMKGYKDHPIIPSYDWDGEALFLLNSSIRNEGFGYLYSYNWIARNPEALDPVGTTCCYRDASWSPDGSYLAFAFQDLNLGTGSTTLLYYVAFGTLGTGMKYVPFTLPEGIFTNFRDKPMPVLRPVSP